MAGVKPHEYLLGIGGFVLMISAVVSFVFALMGGFKDVEFLKFASVLISSSVASILLGSAIGISSKNQQAATALGAPISMILAFIPLVARFNETVEKAGAYLYTYQVNILVNNIAMTGAKPYLMIFANAAVLFGLFIFVYTKKGLRG